MLVPCKHKNVLTLCVPHTGASVWPLALIFDHKVWIQDAPFDLMSWWFLVVSSTTTERLGNHHPQDWEPTAPFHTHSGCVIIFCIFNYSCLLWDRKCTCPQRNWKSPVMLSAGQVPNILCCFLGIPDRNPIFWALLLSSLLEWLEGICLLVAKPRRSCLGRSTRTLWGSRTCSFACQANWEQRMWRMQLENTRRGRASVPTILISHRHYKPDSLF